ncbi:SusF/SusE family outer membrane protein [Kaistella daneshvariae]|uniref:SusF/SusE family outer membrane protein n=1 Tax=Kaistella daneshvariae TaxID=2487074 RepID=UPI0011CEC2EB|nr:SusF/SusE family outer membrane protein [Kaistella daneshvariae]
MGDATPIGWHIEKALALENVSGGVYKYSGPLFAGNYKFANNQDACWCQDFYVKDSGDATKVVKNGADNQWTVSALAQFDVTVNLNTMNIDIQQTSATPSYKDFWMIGDATPAGWSMDDVINQKFSVNPNNSAEYYYQGSFNSGEFKIFMGPFNNFCGSFYMPMSNHQSFTDTSAQVATGCSTDNKWQIPSAGVYTVIVNPNANTVKVVAGLYLSVANSLEKNLTLFPNPSREKVFIQSKNVFNNILAYIYDSAGRNILNVNVNNNQIDISRLKPGNYILKIDDKKEKYTAKIIVK